MLQALIFKGTGEIRRIEQHKNNIRTPHLLTVVTDIKWIVAMAEWTEHLLGMQKVPGGQHNLKNVFLGLNP